MSMPLYVCALVRLYMFAHSLSPKKFFVFVFVSFKRKERNNPFSSVKFMQKAFSHNLLLFGCLFVCPTKLLLLLLLLSPDCLLFYSFIHLSFVGMEREETNVVCVYVFYICMKNMQIFKFVQQLWEILATNVVVFSKWYTYKYVCVWLLFIKDYGCPISFHIEIPRSSI